MSGLTEYEKNTVKNRRKKKKQLMLERIKEIEGAGPVGKFKLT